MSGRLLSRLAISITISATIASNAGAQGAFHWPAGKRAAIALTYDDALLSQLDIAIPQLDSAGFKGTFFLTSNFTDAQMERWRAAAREGHELGNHSLYHPCLAKYFPAEPEYTAERYRVRTIIREIGVMDRLLHAIDGATVHPYAVPCSDARVSDGGYLDSLGRSGLVSYVRNGGPRETAVISDPARLDRFDVPSYGPTEDPGSAAMIAFVDEIRRKGGVGVVQFHGVGGDYLAVSAKTHRDLLQYLARTPDVWVGTFQEVMDQATRAPAR